MTKKVTEVLKDIEENKYVEIKHKKSPGDKVKHLCKVATSMIITLFLIMSFIVSAYRVPTGSMEKTINIGDMLLVNKFVYGFRTPDWLGIPFTEIGFDIPWFKFPQFKKVKRGDVVVFKPPMEPNIHYVKRCVGIPGDTLQYVDKKLYVNGRPFSDFYKSLEVDSAYQAGFPKPRAIDRRILPNDFGPQEKQALVRDLMALGLYNTTDSLLFLDPKILNSTQIYHNNGNPVKVKPYDYFLQVYSIAFADQLLNSLDSDALAVLKESGYHIGKPLKIKVAPEEIIEKLPFRDNFGPIVVPEDHYFMVGDNRDNSLDSRYWGFVNKNFIVGKPIMVYFSYDSDYPFSKLFQGIRWERIGYLIQ